MKFQDTYIRINPKKIALLKFIIEGYDGLAQVTTIDRHAGLVLLAAPEARMNELFPLLENIADMCCRDQP